MQSDFVFFSESVTEGHPDKLCDQISDAVVDRFLQQDPASAIVAECAVSTGIVFLAARFASEAVVDFAQVARRVIEDVGYDQADFNPRTCTIVTSLKELPRTLRLPLNQGGLPVEDSEPVRAKNAVTAFGFACDHTPTLMPYPIDLAHRLARRLAAARREKTILSLIPDGTVQVGVEFNHRKPCRLHTIAIVAAQNLLTQGQNPERFNAQLREVVIEPVLRDSEVRADANTVIYINPEGGTLVGGPALHSGLTGRKTAIDTYGEYSRHSGSALSGKDPSRIDRVGAYAARYAAKNVVAAGLARECEVQLSYTIGLPHPVSLQVETFGTGMVENDRIAEQLHRCIDFRLAGILRAFALHLLPSRSEGGFFQRLAAYGQMGREDLGVPWERIDRTDALRELRS